MVGGSCRTVARRLWWLAKVPSIFSISSKKLHSYVDREACIRARDAYTARIAKLERHGVGWRPETTPLDAFRAPSSPLKPDFHDRDVAPWKIALRSQPTARTLSFDFTEDCFHDVCHPIGSTPLPRIH